MEQIFVKPYRLNRLFALIDERKFAVPRLQREFVWTVKKACLLLDSIDRNYPIGTAMIWPAAVGEHRASLRLQNHILPQFDDERNREIFFIIDGQQRLSVLHQLRHGARLKNSRNREIDFGSIQLDLNPAEAESRFVAAKRPDRKRHIRVADILASDWRRKLRRLAAYKQRIAEKFRERFLQYEVILIFTRTRNLEAVRDTFIRINSQGTPVSKADRAFARASRIDLRSFSNEVRHGLRAGFDRIEPDVVLSSFALIRGETEISERAIARVVSHAEEEDEGERWYRRHVRSMKLAIEHAVAYLTDDLGVFTFALLPSQNMVSLLAVFFFHQGRGRPNNIQRRELRKWFWATAVGQRYSGRGFRSNVATDAEFLRRLGHSKRGRFALPELFSPHDLRIADYSRRSALTDAFYLMLASHEPRYLEDGEPIPMDVTSARANSKQRHHIFPRALLASRKVSSRAVNSICNICFIVAQHNQSIGRKRPSIYLEKFRKQRQFARAMKSHLIPHGSDSPLWDHNIARGFREFSAQRLKMILKAFEERAGMRLFRKEQ